MTTEVSESSTEEHRIARRSLWIATAAFLLSVLQIAGPWAYGAWSETEGSIRGEEERYVSKRSINLRGTASNIEGDHAVWLIVKPAQDLRYYAVAVDRQQDEWTSSRILLGEKRQKRGIEGTFLIYLYVVDPQGNTALQAATRRRIPAVTAPPPGSQLLDSIIVRRSA
jgi:hypothetical protein